MRRLEANFTKASLLVPETRLVAALLLDNVDRDTWKQRIEQDNILQARTVNTAKSYASVVRDRLNTCGPELWVIIAKSDKTAATQATLVATLKFSLLLNLFMQTALADEYRRMSGRLENGVWNTFFSDQALVHPNLANMSTNTQAKLRQNAYRILTEAGYLGHSRSRPLQRVDILPEIRNYLASSNETDVLVAMECAQ